MLYIEIFVLGISSPHGSTRATIGFLTALGMDDSQCILLFKYWLNVTNTK